MPCARSSARAKLVSLARPLPSVAGSVHDRAEIHLQGCGHPACVLYGAERVLKWRVHQLKPCDGCLPLMGIAWPLPVIPLKPSKHLFSTTTSQNLLKPGTFIEPHGTLLRAKFERNRMCSCRLACSRACSSHRLKGSQRRTKGTSTGNVTNVSPRHPL